MKPIVEKMKYVPGSTQGFQEVAIAKFLQSTGKIEDIPKFLKKGGFLKSTEISRILKLI